ASRVDLGAAFSTEFLACLVHFNLACRRRRVLNVTSRLHVKPLDVLNRCPDALLRQIAAPEVALWWRLL
ncbi:MAG: hypothetical protein WA673_21545, partial [Candidatus Acidiferrales bacterium]